MTVACHKITQSYNIKKVIKDFKADDVIQYSNSILTLSKTHGLESRLVIMCKQTSL